ncbi:MAG: adenosine deaminase [Micropruina sp.]|uniref:adenosine deaminase n=1 Tax=Micropruina sp. TaxID=2737536 RepID=UPI0039E66345
MARDLDALPKAHLHLHFTGSMSIASLRRLADWAGIALHDSLLDAEGLLVPPDQRGWFRFQRLYDMARQVVCSEQAMRFVVAQAARDDAAEGSRRLELQVDPSSYAPHVGGLAPALEIVLDEARRATAETGVQVAIVVAASRVRHPLDARTIARLAARHAGENGVIAFGLSNNERAGLTADWEPAFRIARNAGLPGVPHGGELLGPGHLRQVLEQLRPTRIGHGVRSAEEPALLDELVRAGIALEVCPASNVHLGVYREAGDVPLRRLLDAGAVVALGADDPLLFLSRLTDQYRLARDEHGFSDQELAELARCSIRASLAGDTDKARWLAEVDDWLRLPETSDAA